MDDAASRIAGSPEEAGAGAHRVPSNASDVPLAAFAHELRNALGPVRTAAHLLRAGVRDDAQAQWALDLIDRQVNSIAPSIDELADVALVMRGALELGSDLVDLGEAVDSAASACTTALTEKRQALRWTRPADQAAVRGDGARLVQALAAVLCTTSRVAAAGSQISVQLNRARRGVEIVICETAPENTTGRADADSGAGSDSPAPPPAASVGLTLAGGIFALHGGSLTAGDGARFAIRLPLASASGATDN